MSSIDSGEIVLRRSERIRNRNSMLLETNREAARVVASVRHKRKNKVQRHKQTTSSCSTLPDDLVVEVLHRLPPKPFFLFRNNFKNWLPLFSAAAPLNKHLQPNLGGFFYNKLTSGIGFANLPLCTDKVEIDETISGLSCHGALRIHDCCNGLLLVEVLNEKLRDAHNMYMYNPTTWSTVASASFLKQNFHGLLHQEFSLAFNHRLYTEFHIISFSKQIDRSEINFIEIFSFEKGECKHYTKLFYEVTIKEDSWGTFVDGRVYRQTCSRELLSVDPKDSSYEVINLPYLEQLTTFTEIVQSQGLVHCIAISSDLRLVIWILKSYTSKEWTLKYQLRLFDIYSFEEIYDCSFICDRIWNQGNIIFHPKKDIIFLPLGRRAFLSFDLSTGKRCDHGDLRKMGHCWFYMVCYLA